MKRLTIVYLIAATLLVGGCTTAPFDSSTLPGYLGESDLRSMGGSYEYTPTIHVKTDEPEVDYDRLYRKWRVMTRRYGD